LQLEKNSVFGKNTRFLVADGSGSLKEADLQTDRSYLGYVAEYPNLMVSAVLSEDGLFANVIRHGQDSIRIEPREVDGELLHYVSAPVTNDYNINQTHTDLAEDLDGANGDVAQSTGAILTMFSNMATSVSAADGSTATQRPSRVMDVYEFEVGVEIGSRALLNNYSGSTTAQKTAAAMAVAQGIPGNLDARYLRPAGIKYRLGTVIIRTSASEDKFNVRNGNDEAGLNAFRDYWNANPGEVGSTHDLAVYHVRANPSGLAFVNTLGGSGRYALCASNGPTSWADGTLAHEFGHTWNLRHTNSAPISNYNYGSNQDPPTQFYETKPRNNGNAAGGSHVFITPMNGNGNHNIGRFSTDEANEIYRIRQGKRNFGNLVSNPPQVGPFGHRDFAVSNGGAVTIDVIANDYDCNNDVLDVQLRDTVSQKGATITLSNGTGPGGRDELIYTPPAGLNGIDFFHYNVCDTTGRRDWGAVYVSNRGPSIVDLSKTQYFYDLGTSNSPVFNGNSDPYQRLSNETFGDLGFTSNGPNQVEARDRGATGGANALNRDHVRMRSASTFKHKLAAGVYNILFTVGDAAETTNAINISAEGGAASLSTNSHPAGNFTNYTLQNVTVTDGELNVNIENQGFTSNIPRIIITRVGDAAPPAQGPLGGSARSLTNRLQVEDYDIGGQGVAYNDNDATNNGGQGRTNEGVDLANAADEGGGLCIGWTGNGEWMEYTVNVPAGTYDLVVRSAANPANPGGLRFSLNGTNIGTVDISNSGGWQTWKTETLTGVNVPAANGGVLRLTVVDGAGFNINWVQLVAASGGGNNGGGNNGGGNNGGGNNGGGNNGGNGDGTGTAPQTTSSTNTGAFYNAATYQWDFGTTTSPLFNGYSRISEATTQGYARWSNNSGVRSVDRGGSQNALNRDFVYSNQAKTFSQEIANGTYEVAVNLFDANYLHDNMQVRAEGQVKLSNQTFGASAGNDTRTFNVTVTDGQLDLEFSDQGGNDRNWVLNRIVITRSNSSGGGNSGGGSSQPLQFDFGTASSPLQADYIRVSPDTRSGAYRWTNNVSATDRGTAGNANSLNRDLNYLNQSRDFEVTGLANGNWQEEVTIGDASYPHDNIRVRTRGGIIFNSENVASNQFKVESRIQNVTDGKVVITFSDEGGNDANWVVTRVRLTKQ